MPCHTSMNSTTSSHSKKWSLNLIKNLEKRRVLFDWPMINDRAWPMNGLGACLIALKTHKHFSSERNCLCLSSQITTVMTSCDWGSNHTAARQHNNNGPISTRSPNRVIICCLNNFDSLIKISKWAAPGSTRWVSLRRTGPEFPRWGDSHSIHYFTCSSLSRVHPKVIENDP